MYEQTAETHASITSQQAISTAQQSEENPMVILGEIRFVPKYESSIPQDITSSIMSRERLPTEMPALGSSMIEDFVLTKIHEGMSSPEQIADAFVIEGIPEKVNQYIESIRNYSDSLVWKHIFTTEDAVEVRTKICQEMAALGMTRDQIATVERMEVAVAEGIGSSSLSHEEVFASRLQAVRKAMDYVTVFGDAVPIEQVLTTLMASTIGHELGHKVDKVAGVATNNIPMDKNWEKNGQTYENKGERFAEYWGNVADPQSSQITQREWLIHLAKVTQLWKAVDTHNQTHEDKVDLMGIFMALDVKIGDNNKDMRALLHARRALYGGYEVESYASPYTREVVATAVKPSEHATK